MKNICIALCVALFVPMLYVVNQFVSADVMLACVGIIIAIGAPAVLFFVTLAVLNEKDKQRIVKKV